MRLDQLLDEVEVVRLDGDPATDVVDVAYASDRARPGTLFCCLRGVNTDGHDHARDAVARGAVALLVDRGVDVPAARAQVQVLDTRAAMAPIAAAMHGHPSKQLRVVGVTGTNGKSTTTALVRAILERSGAPCGVIGSLNSARTTPESPDLQARLAAMVREGKRAASIEVSSVGLVQRRVDAVRFGAAIFTNLSQDELAFHGSMEKYFEAKATLFARDRTEVGVVNADDAWGQRLLARADACPMVPFSLEDAHDLKARDRGGSTFTWRGAPVELHLVASYDVYNALAAATACAELGVDVATIASALSAVEPLPGHGERVEEGQPFIVLVDYAHTAGAMAAVLHDAKRFAAPGGRVIVVFGSGGDRDRSRRSPMGEAAGTNADVVIVTSDNPRTEDPDAIIEDILDGARRQARDLRVIADRAEAIGAAIREARAGDAVVIAGKGPETGQTIGTEVLPFDDREVARDALRALGHKEVTS